jgi:hypothetical protein
MRLQISQNTSYYQGIRITERMSYCTGKSTLHYFWQPFFRFVAYKVKNSFVMSSFVSVSNLFAEENVKNYKNYCHNTRLEAIHIIII